MNDRAARRVLLVEDHALLRHSLTSMLDALGYVVHAVGSGDEALARFEAGLEVDAVLSDIRMPGRTNGVALARWLREHRPRIAVLLQTGYAEFDTNGFAVLRKPFDGTELEQALERILSGDRGNA